MRRNWLIGGAGAVGAGALGWFTATIPAPPEQAGVRLAAVLNHAGAEAGAARERFQAFGLGQEAIVDPEAFQAPPSPDVALLFRRDLTAIERNERGVHAVIVDYAAPSGRRRLSAGDVYQDGWRVARITPQRIVLRRQRAEREVAVFELPPEGTP